MTSLPLEQPQEKQHRHQQQPFLLSSSLVHESLVGESSVTDRRSTTVNDTESSTESGAIISSKPPNISSPKNPLLAHPPVNPVSIASRRGLAAASLQTTADVEAHPRTTIEIDLSDVTETSGRLKLRIKPPQNQSEAAELSSGKSPTTPSPLTSPEDLSPEEIEKRAVEALQGFIDSKGGLAKASEVSSYLGVIHKFKHAKARVRALAVLISTRDNLILSSVIKSKIPDLMRIWLTNAIKEPSKEQHEVILATLQALEVLPMTFEVLKTSSLGKLINRLKKHELQEINELAISLYEKWKELLATAEGDVAMTDAPAPAGTPAPIQPTKPIQVASKLQPSKTTKTLESHSKPVKRTATETTARKAVDFDIFEMFKPADLAQKAKKQKIEQKIPVKTVSPPSSTPSITPSTSLETIASVESRDENMQPAVAEDGTKSVSTKKKKVSWAPDSLLCQIKLFHSEISEEKGHRFKSAREMDRNEAGAALEMMRKEITPTVEWRTPDLIAIPGSIEKNPVDSKESAIQAERERTILAEIYIDSESIPNSPKEPEYGEVGSGDDTAVSRIPLWPQSAQQPAAVPIQQLFPQQHQIFNQQNMVNPFGIMQPGMVMPMVGQMPSQAIPGQFFGQGMLFPGQQQSLSGIPMPMMQQMSIQQLHPMQQMKTTDAKPAQYGMMCKFGKKCKRKDCRFRH